MTSIKDLIVVVADKSMMATVVGILGRPHALGIRPIAFDVKVHMNYDSGVRVEGVSTIHTFRSEFSHALLLLDYEGCGADENAAKRKFPAELQDELAICLRQTWGEKSDVIVINPELDVWVWGGDNILRELLGWQETASIRDWLKAKGFEFGATGKPIRPKEAFDCVLRQCRQSHSASMYRKIAERISLSRCTDESFQRLSHVLQDWFPSVERLERQ
jgi:hypothetical protein